ncbi:MAG TPA: SufBD protein [Bacilli bacterium]|nr:SufBD protein [Bacilli bacterium]
MENKLNILINSDDKSAYSELLELETICTESNELYNYFDTLLGLLRKDNLFLRVRGFRLICSLAKWDKDNKINDNIDYILDTLNDDNGVCIRQCLLRLNLILLYKPELSNKIENKLNNMDLSIYKESMSSLIKRDIKKIIESI